MQFLNLSKSHLDKWWAFNLYFKYLQLTHLNFRYNSKERKVTQETKWHIRIFYLSVIFIISPHLSTALILMARLLQGDESLYRSETERGLRMIFGALFISINSLYFIFAFSIIFYLKSFLQAFNSIFRHESEMISKCIIYYHYLTKSD
jgi:hypothetical protein